MSATPECPRCGNPDVRRTRRVGFIERLLSLVYVYPFRCARCLHRFRVMRWGTRYYKRALV